LARVISLFSFEKMAVRLLIASGILGLTIAEYNISSPSLRGANGTKLTTSRANTPLHLAWAKHENFCLSSDGNRIANGVKVHLWDCDNSFESQGQNFMVDESNRIRMYANPEYCLVIDGDEFANGSKIQLWKCNEKNDNQRWFSDLMGSINAYNQPGFCLVIDGNEAFNGAKIQLWSCNGAPELKAWMKIALAANGRAFGVPKSDSACQAPFEAATSQEACLQAAEALRPGQGCMWGKWKDVIAEDSKPNWPRGCYFYGACQGGCGLYFNPTGEGQNCPSQGDCMSISMICQLQQ